MTAVDIPHASVDLAPGLPSRIVYGTVLAPTEDRGPKGAWIEVSIPGEIKVPGQETTVTGRAARVPLNTDGTFAVRLPTASEGIEPEDWALSVRMSWRPVPFPMRVPVGEDPIWIEDCVFPELVPGEDPSMYFLSGAQVRTVETLPPGSAATAKASVEGGMLSIDLGLPQGPQGLPGMTAIEGDEAVAGYISTTGQSATRDALMTTLTETGTRPVGKDEITVNAADHGVSPSNTTNSSLLSAALVVAAARNVPLRLERGVYRMTGFVDLPDGTDLRMDPGAVLDYSESGASAYLRVYGSINSTRHPATGATEGAYTITATGHSLAADDWVKVSSDDVFDPLNTGIPLGELVQVQDVQGDTIHLWTPLRDTYTTNVRVQAVTMRKNVRVSGGTIRGNRTPNTGKTGLTALYAQNLTIDGTRFEHIDMRHVGINNCVNAWLRNCEFEWNQHSGMGYAVSFANATRDSGCTNSSFLYTRHAFSTNNSSSGDDAGIVRRITFAFNRVENSARATGGGGGDAIDTHAAAQDIDILYNRVNGASGAGINVGNPSSRVVGNTILDAGTYGIGVDNNTNRDGEHVIIGNIVKGSGQGWSGIRQSSGYLQGTGRVRGLVIANNVISDSDVGIRAGRNPAAPGAVNDDSFSITGNTIRDCTRAGISLVRADNVSVNGNAIWRTGQGVILDRCSYVSVGPDSIRDWNAPGFVGIDLIDVDYARVQPGAIRAGTGTGVRIDADCSNMTVGPTSHIFASTKLQNNGPSSVVTGA